MVRLLGSTGRALAAMQIRSSMQPGAFGPEAIEAMSEVLDTSWDELGDTSQPDMVREIMAGVTRLVCGRRHFPG
jgi:hypothetical protein